MGSKEVFKSSRSVTSETKEPETKKVTSAGVTLSLTDQPGLFDTEGEDEALMRSMAIKNSEELKQRGGYNCVLLLFNVNSRLDISEEIVIEVRCLNNLSVS